MEHTHTLTNSSDLILSSLARTRLVELLSEFAVMLRDEAERNSADPLCSEIYLHDASLVEALSQIVASGTLSQLSPSGSLPHYQNILFAPDSPAQPRPTDPIEIQDY